MMSYLDTIETFRQLVSAGAAGNDVNVGAIVDLFVSDAAGPATVGLTLGTASLGPWFSGKTGPNSITSLFTALNQSFPNLALTYPNNERPADGDTVVVEALLNTGPQGAQWGPQGAAASPPISPIHPAPVGKPNGSQNLPVCAVFRFGAGGGIRILSLYFDRWRLAQDLWDGMHPPNLEPR